MATLNPKALSLFVESYKRTVVTFGDHTTVHTDPAWTGDIEHETATEGALPNSFDNGLSVQRIGSWYTSASFSSSISKGSRSEQTDSSSVVTSINMSVPYSDQQLVNMRTSPDTVVVSGQATDTYSVNPGPFNSVLTFTIWAEESPITLIPYSNTVRTPYNFPGTTTTTETVPANSSPTFYGPIPITAFATVGISGRTTSIDNVVKLGIQSDGATNPYWTDVSKSITVPSVNIPAESTQYTWTFYKVVKSYYIDRTLASYAIGGYQGDFYDTIVNAEPPELSTDLVGVPAGQ